LKPPNAAPQLGTVVNDPSCDFGSCMGCMDALAGI
jgi:hypothetical protein